MLKREERVSLECDIYGDTIARREKKCSRVRGVEIVKILQPVNRLFSG